MTENGINNNNIIFLGHILHAYAQVRHYPCYRGFCWGCMSTAQRHCGVSNATHVGSIVSPSDVGYTIRLHYINMHNACQLAYSNEKTMKCFHVLCHSIYVASGDSTNSSFNNILNNIAIIIINKMWVNQLLRTLLIFTLLFITSWSSSNEFNLF
jgi:hypothetical protein